MLAKVLSQVIISLASSFASWIFKTVSKAFSRKKKHKELEEKAQKVEDAKTHDEVRVAADDLP